MSILKPHLAINIRELDASLHFYKTLFNQEPVRVRTDYAKFDLQEPALNFTINVKAVKDPGALNHLGLQVSSSDDVLAAKKRLTAENLHIEEELNTVCCYALQDKIWVSDPDGNRWEVFTVIDQETDALPLSYGKYTDHE